jgi:hypothetical protein
MAPHAWHARFSSPTTLATTLHKSPAALVLQALLFDLARPSIAAAGVDLFFNHYHLVVIDVSEALRAHATSQ